MQTLYLIPAVLQSEDSIVSDKSIPYYGFAEGCLRTLYADGRFNHSY